MKTTEDVRLETTSLSTVPQKFVLVEADGFPPSDDGESMGKEDEERGPVEYEEAITACGYGKFHYVFLIAMIPVCSAQLFSSGTMSFVLPVAECDLELTNFHKGALNAGVYAGMIMAAFFWGFASDILGRRKLIIIGFFLDATFNFLTSLAHSFWLLLLLKVFGGLSITGPNALVYSYMAETHDNAHRPKVIMITGGLTGLAQAIQPAMAYMVIPQNFRWVIIPEVLEFTSWRLFLIICSLPSAISALVFFFVPESPKFLMSKGRTAEAMQSFRKIYSINSGKPPHTYPVKELQAPPKQAPSAAALAASSPSGGGVLTLIRNGWIQIRPIFLPPYLNIAILVFGIQICIMICINSLRLWVPQLFATLDQAAILRANSTSNELAEAASVCDLLTSVVGPSSAELAEEGHFCPPMKGDVYLRSLVIGVAAAISFVISTSIIGCVGKKNIARTCFPLAAAMAIAMNWAMDSDTFMAFMAIYTAMLGNALTAMNTLTVDLFPTAFRSMSLSLTMMFGRIASLTGNLLFPILLNLSCSAVFFSIGGVLALAGVLVWLIPNRIETR